jgi:hypothetical protein
MPSRWSRRSLLGACLALPASLAGCTTLDEDRMRPKSALDSEGTAVYAREGLRLRGPDRPVRVGDRVEFVLTNTGSETAVGCWADWTVQRRDGEWEELVWTTPDSPQGCAKPVGPGESHAVDLSFTETGIEAASGATVRGDLEPGRYRFVALGTEPPLAVRFDVVPE